MTPRGRRWRRIFVVLAMITLALCTLAPLLIDRMVRRQLQTLAAGDPGAHLTIQSVAYTFPYGITLTGAVLTIDSPGKNPPSVITVPRLEFALAHSPFIDGPLVFDKVIVTEPRMYAVRTTESPANGSSPIASSIPDKLSSAFQIHQINITGGQCVIDDRRFAGSVPLVLNALSVKLRQSGGSPAVYEYDLSAQDAPQLSLKSNGTADIDDLTVNVKSCKLAASVDSELDKSALDPRARALLHAWAASGTLQLDGDGTFPFKHLADARYHSRVQLRDARATIPGLQLPLDSLAATIDWSESGTSHPALHIDSLEASDGDLHVAVTDAFASADLKTNTWRLDVKRAHLEPASSGAVSSVSRALPSNLRMKGSADFEFSAAGPLEKDRMAEATGTLVMHPHDFTLQPPGFDRPIAGFGDATVSFANGELQCSALRATYADNLLFIKAARLRATDLPGHVNVNYLAGCLTLGANAIYPPPLDKYLRGAHLVGPYFFGGTLALDTAKPRSAIDYHLNVHTSRGRLTLGASNIPLTDINAVASVSPAGASISEFNASMLGGSMTGTGTMQFTREFPYSIRADCRSLDLKILAKTIARPGKTPPRLSGRGVLSVELQGAIPSDDSPASRTLKGKGEFEIRRADFWEVPILKSIAGAFSKDALTFGQAAGQFRIADSKVHFDRAAVTSPLLGVEGFGDVTFAGDLDLRGIADPFGSWADRVGGNGLIAEIADALQRTVNIAARQILYEIHVTGTIEHPQTTRVLAPIVTRPVQALLQLTHEHNQSMDVLGELRKQADEPMPEPPVNQP